MEHRHRLFVIRGGVLILFQLGARINAVSYTHLGCAVLMNGVPSSAVTSNFDGSIAAVLRDEFSVDLPSAANTMANLLCAGLLFLFLEVTFMSVLALRQGLARDGWLGYLKNRSLAARAVRALLRGAGRVWRAVSGTLGRMWRALTAIDLRDPAEKTLLRLLARCV